MSYYNWEEIVAKYTDAELIHAVKESRGLQKEKVSAAINELKKRGIEPNNYNQVLKNVEDEKPKPDENSPTLYSQRVIYIFSVLFSIIFGGILFAINLKEVGKKQGIYLVIGFLVVYTTFSIYILNLIKASGTTGAFFMGAIGALVLNEVFWGKYIGKDKAFHKKSWVKPLIIALVIFIPFTALVIWAHSVTGIH